MGPGRVMESDLRSPAIPSVHHSTTEDRRWVTRRRGQAMLAAILISILSVIIAPALVPGLLKVLVVTIGASWWTMACRPRSTSWRASLSGSAVALLGLGFSFTAALMTNLYTTESVVAISSPSQLKIKSTRYARYDCLFSV